MPGPAMQPDADWRFAERHRELIDAYLRVGGWRLEVDLGLRLCRAVHESGEQRVRLSKALDFKPIGEVRDFVFHYPLDERPVDTAALQSNLEHYKRLEAQARDAERRLEALDAICSQGERIAQERRTAESHRYLSLRAEVELAEAQVGQIEGRLEETARQREALTGDLARTEDQLAFFRRERERLSELLLATPGFREIQALERDLDDTRRAITEAAEAEARARRILDGQRGVLETLLGQEARDVRHTHAAVFTGPSLIGAADAPAVVARLRETLARDGHLAGRDLATWTRHLGQAADAITVALARLGDNLSAAKQEGRLLEAEQAELERGRQRYPDGAQALLHLLRARLRGAQEPRPLCELIDVAAERWRDAVEGYLNTRRFDVIVAPGDFPRALTLYEHHKRDYALPGRGPVFIANVGLVDIERIQALAPRREPRSLAEQVTTDDAHARAYVDFLLGDVICCGSEQELRRHRRAITDTVMVYQNHVARQTPPEVFRRHYIGEAARVRRREEIARRLAELSQAVLERRLPGVLRSRPAYPARRRQLLALRPRGRRQVGRRDAEPVLHRHLRVVLPPVPEPRSRWPPPLWPGPARRGVLQDGRGAHPGDPPVRPRPRAALSGIPAVMDFTKEFKPDADPGNGDPPDRAPN